MSEAELKNQPAIAMKVATSQGASGDASNFRIKIMVLLGLCCQAAGQALLVRYSRTVLKETYDSSEVVMVSETIKLVASAIFVLSDSAETDSQGQGTQKLLWLIFNAKKVVVLVLLYSAANLLSYFALARVDASVYTVLTQLKILTTAGFAVLILRRNISLTKWRALFLLVLSCVLVASPTYNIPADSECSADVEDIGETNDGSTETNFGAQMMGVAAILIMTLTSGFSAIYFESVLKATSEKVTIWERNFQLAFFSVSLLLLIRMWEYFVTDSDSAADTRMFHGWSFVTVLVSAVAATGGLLVAATLKYADAILKTMATAGSIVLATILGNLLLADYIDVFVILGCICTILAIVNYTFE